MRTFLLRFWPAPNVWLSGGAYLLFVFFSFVAVVLQGAPPPCSAPVGVSVTNIGPSSATVNWNAVSGISQYRVQYRLTPNGAWTNSGVVINALTHSITGLAQNTHYETRVGSRCQTGEILYGAPLAFVSGCPVPAGLTESNVQLHSIDLNWNAVPNVNSYWVRYRIGYNPQWSYQRSVVPATALYNLVPHTGYEIQVATNCVDSVFSEYSSAIFVFTGGTDSDVSHTDFCGIRPINPDTTHFAEAVDRWGYPAVSAPYKKPSGAMQAMTASLITQTCGDFTLYFPNDDVAFNDTTTYNYDGETTLGGVRKKCACKVFEYLSTVIDVKAFNSSIKPDILFKSYYNPNSQTVGEGGCYYEPSNLQCRRNYIEKYIIDGIDLTPSGPPTGSAQVNEIEYHGLIKLNTGAPVAVNYDYLNFNQYPGKFSLYSVLLHEAMHVLGFGATLDTNGNCTIGANQANSFFTQFLYKDTPGPNTYILQTDCKQLNNSVITPTNFINNKLLYKSKFFPDPIQPIHSPAGFVSGTSLSHFDKIRGGGGLDYIMRPGDVQFKTSNLLTPEVRVLCDLEYTLKTPYSCGTDFSYIISKSDEPPAYDIGNPQGPTCFSVLGNDQLINWRRKSLINSIVYRRYGFTARMDGKHKRRRETNLRNCAAGRNRLCLS